VTCAKDRLLRLESEVGDEHEPNKPSGIPLFDRVSLNVLGQLLKGVPTVALRLSAHLNGIDGLN
jgi:hypothetical protein